MKNLPPLRTLKKNEITFYPNNITSFTFKLSFSLVSNIPVRSKTKKNFDFRPSNIRN